MRRSPSVETPRALRVGGDARQGTIAIVPAMPAS